VVEERKVFLRICVYVVWLFEQHRTHEVVENLPQLSMVLNVAHMLLFDLVFDLGEVGLQLRVEVVLLLHRRLQFRMIID
jgi:hypothetical protein